MLGSPLYSASKKFTIKTASVLPPTLYTGECRVGGRMRIVGTTSFFFFSLSHTTVLLFLLPFSWMSSVCSVCPLNLPSVFLICPSDSWLFCVIYTVLYMHKFDSHACIWYRSEVLLVIKNCAFFPSTFLKTCKSNITADSLFLALLWVSCCMSDVEFPHVCVACSRGTKSHLVKNFSCK